MAYFYGCGAEDRLVVASAANAPAEPHGHTFTGTPGVSTSVFRSGSASFRSNAAGAAKNWGLTLAQRVVAGRIYFRVDDRPSATSHFLSFIQAGGDGLVRMTTAGQITVQVVGSAAAVNVGSAIAENDGVWHWMDFCYDSSGATTTLKAKIDDGTEAQDSFAQTAADVTSFRWGWQGSVTADMYIDDILLGNASGDYPVATGYVIEGPHPDADGTHSFTAGDFGYGTAGADILVGATDVWQSLDDADLSSTADPIRQKVVRSTGYVEVQFPDPVSTTDPLLVMVVLSMHSDGTGANTMGWKLNDGGTIVAINDTAGDGLTDISNTAIAHISKGYATRPNGGGPWTLAAYKALRVRGGYSTDVVAVPYWDGVVLEVVFPESAGESHEGSVVATGGGVVSVTKTTVRSQATAASGGGVAAVTKTTVRSQANTATGSGVASPAGTSARSESTTATGGGTATIDGLGSRSVSISATGGGAAVVVPTSARAISVESTGGGIAVIDGATGSDSPTVSVQSTGGGVATIDATSGRSASVVATGSGSATPDVAAARSASVTAIGSGSATLTLTGVHGVSVSATGGGSAIVVGEGPLGDPLPQDVVVTVAMTALSGASVDLDAEEVLVSLDQPPTAEVELT